MSHPLWDYEKESSVLSGALQLYLLNDLIVSQLGLVETHSNKLPFSNCMNSDWVRGNRWLN